MSDMTGGTCSVDNTMNAQMAAEFGTPVTTSSVTTAGHNPSTSAGTARPVVKGQGAKAKGLFLDSWMTENPGVVRDLKDPGAKTHVAELKHWYCCELGPVMWKLEEEICDAGTSLPAIDAAHRRRVANCSLKNLLAILVCHRKPLRDGRGLAADEGSSYSSFLYTRAAAMVKEE